MFPVMTMNVDRTWKFPDSLGKPLVKRNGRAKSKAEELNMNDFSVSLSDTKQYAIATAIGT